MRRHLSILLLMIFSAALVSGCGEYGNRYTGSGDAGSSAAKRKVSSAAFDAKVKEKYGCSDIEEFDSEGRNHIDDPKEKVDYKTNPPTSGNHYQLASEWGIYDTQQPDVKTTHGLEHGYIVVSYSGLTGKEIDELTEQVKRDPTHVLLQPRPANPKATAAKDSKEKDAKEDSKKESEESADEKVKPGIYYSAWTAQLFCEKPSSAALQFMLDEWRDQGPELFSSDPGNMGTN